MGRDFHERFAASRLVYEEASDAVGLDLVSLCFHDDPRLGLTAYSQPALVTTQIAMIRGLAEGWGLTAGCFGGHSLGEYTALVAAGVIPLADAVRIVHQRGRLMQEAVPVGDGCMVAVLGRELDRDAIDRCTSGLAIDVANDNSSGQIVLSGPTASMRVAAERLEAGDAGTIERVVELEVSAPFHSRMMEPIHSAFAEVLGASSAKWDVAAAPRVTSNLTGGYHDADVATLCERLVGQLSATVRWRDNMAALAASAAAIFEVGSGRPLRGFFRSLGVDVTSIVDLRSAERVLQTAVAA
jgi:[acyl-carrier-protein] S-malonyltransferase/trans-AT polyketide synthase/acyltransferase/oxidoreductase domain-containing protein